MGARSVEPDGEQIARLRKGRGWTILELATEADCSERSVQNAEAGRPVEPRTLRCIAEALGVETRGLLKDQAQAGQRRTVEIVLAGNDREKAAALAELLALTLQAAGEVTIKLVREGSVIVTLEMDEDDLLRLVTIFPDFREHACAAVAATPEGQAYFGGADPQGLDLTRVERMVELADRVLELRIPSGGPPSDPEGEGRKARRMSKLEELRDRVARARALLEHRRGAEVTRPEGRADGGSHADEG